MRQYASFVTLDNLVLYFLCTSCVVSYPAKTSRTLQIRFVWLGKQRFFDLVAPLVQDWNGYLQCADVELRLVKLMTTTDKLSCDTRTPPMATGHDLVTQVCTHYLPKQPAKEKGKYEYSDRCQCCNHSQPRSCQSTWFCDTAVTTAADPPTVATRSQWQYTQRLFVFTSIPQKHTVFQQLQNGKAGDVVSNIVSLVPHLCSNDIEIAHEALDDTA